MKAAIMVAGPNGGSWDIREVQRPVVSAGQILVRVRASSINRAEFRRLHNLRAAPGKPAPEVRVGGGDAAGEIVELGTGVTGFKPGDRAMGRCAGGFAEYALIDAREAMPVPEGLSWEEAACIPVVFVVVHDALFVSGRLHKGETVLVTAAPRSRRLSARTASIWSSTISAAMCSRPRSPPSRSAAGSSRSAE
jgi:NADPH2:quinone reductase